jgi:hypothetical protein
MNRNGERANNLPKFDLEVARKTSSLSATTPARIAAGIARFNSSYLVCQPPGGVGATITGLVGVDGGQ